MSRLTWAGEDLSNLIHKDKEELQVLYPDFAWSTLNRTRNKKLARIRAGKLQMPPKPTTTIKIPTTPMSTRKARILIYDIETAPLIVTTWGIWEQNAVWVIQDWYMLAFAWKWLDEKETHVLALTDFPKTFTKNGEDDSDLVKALWELQNEADIVVAHNGAKFDQKKANSRYALNGLNRPAPYHDVDTLKVARASFAFTSNKLDDLGEYFSIGKKIATNKDLWKRCMAKDIKAFLEMKKYNKQDVILLEKLYLKFLNGGWIKNHPPVNQMMGKPEACPSCGVEGKMTKYGFDVTPTQTYQRWQCGACFSYCKSPQAVKTGDKTKFKR
jgi:DNA polymerase III epsilon subunit-like protein